MNNFWCFTVFKFSFDFIPGVFSLSKFELLNFEIFSLLTLCLEKHRDAIKVL